LKTYPDSRIKELIKFDTDFNACLIGTDEAGRGPLAGPVVAAAVHFSEFTKDVKKLIEYIDDSKKFSNKPQLRKELSDNIKSVALFSIKECTVQEIDSINILQASLFAMKKACDDVIKQISRKDLLIIVDGRHIIPKYNYAQKAVKKGDTLSASIAAASILAKVHRDEIMQNLSTKFPQYQWHKNKGYPTQFHIDAIRTHGECEIHRKSFLGKILYEQKTIF